MPTLPVEPKASATVPPHTVVACSTYDTVDVSITDLLGADGQLDVYPDVRDGEYFSVNLKKGKVSLRAGGYIGLIPINDRLTIRVESRVPLDNITRLITVSGKPLMALQTLRSYAATDEWNASMLDVYADALLAHVAVIRQSGLMRDYERREETSSFPRGRVLLHPTQQRFRSRGVGHKAVATWFERTTDIPSNQCVKYAIWSLAQTYSRMDVPAEKKAKKRFRGRQLALNAAYAALAGISLDARRAFLRDPTVQGRQPLPALRAYYADALRVAHAIVNQRSVLVESDDGPIRLPAMVVNMNDVFESYVRRVLQLHAASEEWSYAVLDGNQSPGKKPLFNEPGSEDATPDIVIQAPDETIPLVLEVKNVPVTSNHSGRTHIEQAVTYAVSYGINRVVLIHPRASAWQDAGLLAQGTIGSVEVFQYRFDLAAADLIAEDARFGDAVASLLQ